MEESGIEHRLRHSKNIMVVGGWGKRKKGFDIKPKLHA
jgi:hypothetical protein